MAPKDFSLSHWVLRIPQFLIEVYKAVPRISQKPMAIPGSQCGLKPSIGTHWYLMLSNDITKVLLGS